jgi:hypothetical protein
MPRLQTLTLALILSTTLAPVATWAQDSTSSITLTGDELAEIVDRACTEARNKSREADGLRIQRDTVRAQRDQCVGALNQWVGIDAQRIDYAQQLAVVTADRDSRFGKLWVVVGIVAGVALGGVAGWALSKF